MTTLTETQRFFIKPISLLIHSYYTDKCKKVICNDVEGISPNTMFVSKQSYDVKWNWNMGLLNACRIGHMAMVKKMISNGANNWNFGLLGACVRGHMVIVDKMIAKGANKLDIGLYKACRAGHMAVVKKLIYCGATYICCEEHKPLFNK